MIQQFFNGMITLMLAKFMLNDVLHAVGVVSTKKTMYHITSATAWKEISKVGLLPQPLKPEIAQQLGLEKGIYLTTSMDLIDVYAKSAALEDLLEHPERKETRLPILRVVIRPGTLFVEDPESTEFGFVKEGWITDSVVPVQDITVIKTIKMTQRDI